MFCQSYTIQHYDRIREAHVESVHLINNVLTIRDLTTASIRKHFKCLYLQDPNTVHYHEKHGGGSIMLIVILGLLVALYIYFNKS